MKKLRGPAIISLLVIAVLFVVFSMNGEESDEHYIPNIKEERAKKDDFMRADDTSPLPDSLKQNFAGLNYYPPNREYNVTAIIKMMEVREPLTLPTSDGKMERYEKFARAEFRLQGERHQLTLLKPVGFGAADIIFLAFGDQTNGNSTYGGGRYIDLSFKNARQIKIDFNKAYSPYCAYNPNFSCPLPPKENLLKIPIYAGEKNFK